MALPSWMTPPRKLHAEPGHYCPGVEPPEAWGTLFDLGAARIDLSPAGHARECQTWSRRGDCYKYVETPEGMAPDSVAFDLLESDTLKDEPEVIKYPPVTVELTVGKLTVTYGRRSHTVKFVDADGLERKIDDTDGNVMRMLEAIEKGSGKVVPTVVTLNDDGSHPLANLDGGSNVTGLGGYNLANGGPQRPQ